MSMRWHDKKHDDFDEYDDISNVNWDEEIEKSSDKSAKRQMVKRKLEDRMEKRRIRWEIDDYEEELDEGFDWGEDNKK